MRVWLKEKHYLKSLLRKEPTAIGDCAVKTLPPLMFTEHHQSHAASAFFPSPFEEAAVLCMDGVGEWATTSAWLGRNNTLTPQWEINFPPRGRLFRRHHTDRLGDAPGGTRPDDAPVRR